MKPSAIKIHKAIKESKPSEALEELKQIGFYVGTILGLEFENGNGAFSEIHKQDYENFRTKLNTIKQALLKAQEQEKVLEIMKEHLTFEDRGIETYDNKTKYLVKIESKDTDATIHIHLDNQDEFELLKEYFK